MKTAKPDPHIILNASRGGSICCLHCGECWAFCAKLLPRLQARLRFDLNRAASRPQATAATIGGYR